MQIYYDANIKLSNTAVALGQFDALHRGHIEIIKSTVKYAKENNLKPLVYLFVNDPAEVICGKKQMAVNTISKRLEILEETGVVVKAKSLIAMQFKPDQWCAVFECEFVSGEPRSDGYENSEVLLLSAEEAVVREDITNMSREILKSYIEKLPKLDKSDYIAKTSNKDNYVIFGV